MEVHRRHAEPGAGNRLTPTLHAAVTLAKVSQSAATLVRFAFSMR
jgi:hypothetical protein